MGPVLGINATNWCQVGRCLSICTQLQDIFERTQYPNTQNLHFTMLFLVTGCSSGIGLQLAQAILTAGHHCIASSRQPSKTPDIVTDFEKKGGIWIQLDVASPNAGDVIRKVIADHGPIDVLINNAGISDVGPLENHSLQAAQALFETNLWGPLRLTQAIIPSMRERKSGTIVNISSSVVFQPHPLLSMYAASKGALESMTDALHTELGVFGVRTLLVEPGLTRSEFSNTAKQDMGELMTRLEVFKGVSIHNSPFRSCSNGNDVQFR